MNYVHLQISPTHTTTQYINSPTYKPLKALILWKWFALTPFFLFSKIILKLLSRIFFPAMKLCNEVLSESQTKLRWGSTASTNNTLQKYSAHKEDFLFFTCRWNTVMACEPLTEHPGLTTFPVVGELGGRGRYKARVRVEIRADGTEVKRS
jgi:hypothetical protein